jgi:hypothetical protein
MSSPAKMLSPLANIWPGFEKTINKGLGANGNPPDAPTMPTPPQPAPPAQSPTGAANSSANLAQTQLSFLTAASKAAAAIGQGATTGKSLLGA